MQWIEDQTRKGRKLEKKEMSERKERMEEEDRRGERVEGLSLREIDWELPRKGLLPLSARGYEVPLR